MIFQLEWTTYDGAIVHHFQAPEGATEEAFKALCDRLMHEALQEAVDGKPGRSMLHEHPPYLLGYDYGVDEIVARLADHGYNELKFPTVNYTHGTIINGILPEDGEESFSGGERIESGLRAKVAEHNRRITGGLSEKRIRQRILQTETDLTSS